MVASYLQLLERRYGDHFDGQAREFMDFAIDGAKRMKALINAYLEFSRIGTGGSSLEQVDCNQVMREVTSSLEAEISELISEMETAIAEADTFIQSMGVAEAT